MVDIKIEIKYGFSLKKLIQESGRDQAERLIAKQLMNINKQAFEDAGKQVAEEQLKDDKAKSKKTAQPSPKRKKKK